jgi:hypothetical protein
MKVADLTLHRTKAADWAQAADQEAAEDDLSHHRRLCRLLFRETAEPLLQVIK